MPKTPHLALWGANFVGNLGDYAILQGTARLLREAMPECRLSAACHDFTGQDEARTGAFLRTHGGSFEVVSGPSFVHSDRWHRRLVRFHALRKTANRYLFRKARRRLCRWASSSNWASGVSGVAVSGGGHWGWDELTVNLLAQIQTMHNLGKPVWLLPHSMSRSIVNQVGVELPFAILSRCREVALRDKNSFGLAQSLGLKNAMCCPDCAFAVESAVPYRSDKPHRVVLLALRELPYRRTPEYISQLAALAEQLLAAGLTPVLFTTCEVDDRLFFDRALVDLPHLAQHRPVSLEEALLLVSQSAAIVTDRFHCMLFGMLAGTPVVPVTDLEKVCGMVRTVGWRLTVDNEEALTSRLVLQALSMRSETVELQDRFVSSARQQLRALSGRLLAAAQRCQKSGRGG